MGNGKDVKYALILFLIVLKVTYALRNVTTQRVRSFHCINGNYVFSSWFCDNINDCGDASDESYGCDKKCGTGNFTCHDSKCLPISVRCNGVKDCDDGSDEQFCDHEPKLEDCILSKGKFLCNDKLRCVDIGQVCDDEVHCFDGSDEGSRCDEYDPDICNVCPHPCFRTPLGSHCFHDHKAGENGEYEDAYRDVGSCTLQKNYCDQKCVSFKDINQCSCEENFVPTYTLFQSFLCEEKDKDKNMLLFVTKNAIRGIKGYTNTSVVIKDLKENITAISAADEQVYWAGKYDGFDVIGRTSFYTKDTKIIVSGAEFGGSNAIDVDWRTGNVYFIDNKKKRIAACTKDGKRCVEIHKLDYEATAITLAPRVGYMFWAVHNGESDIEIRKSEMNGQVSYRFLDEGLRDVSSMAADEASEKLYWLDAVRRKVEVIKFDGSSTSRKVFKSDLRLNYLSITINGRYLYWIASNNGSIYYSPATRIMSRVALNSSDPVSLIYGYSYSEKTTKMEAPCSWGCKGICLINQRYNNKTGSDCVCSNTSQLMDNGIWCRENTEALFGYNYEDEIYNHYHPTEVPHRPFRIILVIACFVIIISGVAFYLYRNGFSGTQMFRHSRM